MWIGILIYTDGMSTTFTRANTKTEIVNWFDEMGFDVRNIEKMDNYEMIDEGLSVGYIVDMKNIHSLSKHISNTK